jgi:hypothetical protein
VLFDDEAVAGVGTYVVLVDTVGSRPALAAIVAITVTFAGRVITFRVGVRTRAARTRPRPR